MCGIAGIVNLKGAIDNLPHYVKTMTNALRHRGPDGEGFLLLRGDEIISAFGNDTPKNIIVSDYPYSPTLCLDDIHQSECFLALGHRRLSVIDTSAAGHQPMCDTEKKVWLIFNGEIYNYIELRQQLKQAGVMFDTDSDTEVVLKSYLYWGQDCVERFNGMWTFVIFDARKNYLFGSRDRTGVKPFYYYMDDNVFAFASEQKALVKLPFIKYGINYKAAAEFLVGDIQYVEYGEENMFKNIYEILPSHNFTFNIKSFTFRKWRYYDLKTTTSFVAFNEKEFIRHRDETEKRLVDSVRLRLRSDVPVGSCLSGGIDSSTIVGIMAHLILRGEKVNFGERLNVFTLQFDNKKIDESSWAKYVVNKTNSEWNLVKPTAEEFLKDFHNLNYAQDIPVCSTGTYGQFCLMRRAKEKGIKVILDGQGGDELFGGYMTHSVIFWRELLQKGRITDLFSEMSANGNLFFNKKQMLKDWAKRKFASCVSLSLQIPIYRSYIRQYEFLHENVIEEYMRSESMKEELAVNNSASLNEGLLKDFVNTRLKMYLKYEDRSSMWHSIEARTPFADDVNLSEYVFSIPGTYKIHNGMNKYLLREAACKYLPHEIKTRKDKLGFVTPIDEWTLQLKKEFLDLLDDSMSDFINVKKIKRHANIFFRIHNHADAVRVFRTVSFAVWKKIFHL